MPWEIKKMGGKHCVVKKGESRPVPGGCHASRKDAIKHQRALYAGEASSSGATVLDVALPSVTASEVAGVMTELAKGGLTVAEIEEGVEGVATLVAEAETEEAEETIEGHEVLADEDEDSEEKESEEEDDDENVAVHYEGILAIEGMATDDGRFLFPGEVGEREPMPRPLQAQFATADGHGGSVVVGAIEAVEHIPIGEFDKEGFELKEIPDSAIIVWGEGHIDDTEDGQRAIEMIENGAGISVDLPPTRHGLVDAETLEEVDTDEMEPEEIMAGQMEGRFLLGIGGKIAAATICTVPAFPDARLRIRSGKDTVLVASAFGQRVIKLKALTAAAAGKAPLKPPREWFYMPEPNEPTPLTVTDEGQVYGHLALWGQCHAGFAHCETPPSSPSGYQWFHLGTVETAEGEFEDVGRITVGRNGTARGGHASIVLGTQGAIEHYDSTGCCAAFVRAVDGNLGIWLSGAVRSGVAADKIRDLRAFPPSGDWRIENGQRELVGVLAVNVPGYPVPRAEMRLVASAVGDEEVEEVTALILTGYSPEPEVEESTNGHTRAELRAMRVEQMVHGLVEGFAFELESEDFAKITAEQRKRWAKSGIAMPDGSYPITKCEGDGPSAVNAARAIGRAPESKRNAVRRHIARRRRALGCKTE